MTRGSKRWYVVAWLGASAFSLLVVGLGGCGGEEGGTAKAGGSKFKVDSGKGSGDTEQPADDSETKLAAKRPSDDSDPADDAPPSRPAKKTGGQTPTKPPVVSSEKLGDYRVPDGEPQDILAYAQELAERQPRGNSREEKRADFVKIQRACVAAADKLLKLKGAQKELRMEAISTKLAALQKLSQLEEPGAVEEMGKFMAALSNDKDPELARVGRLLAFQFEAVALVNEITKEEGDPKELIVKLKKFLASETKDAEALVVAQQVASLLGQTGNEELAIEAVSVIAAAFIDNEDEKVAGQALSMLEQARFAKSDLQTAFEGVVNGEAQSLGTLQKVVDSLVKAKPLGPQTLNYLSQMAREFERQGKFEAATSVLASLKKAYKGHASQELADDAAQKADAAGRRMGLVNKPFVVEGELLDGSQIDWKKYKGKVVLVDFWATWCQPCLAEIPNLRKNYNKYHAQGLEIIAVNLDDDKMTVERFLADSDTPWPLMHSTDPDAIGMNHPLATKCGVDAIPFILLIDRSGKVTNIHLRGPALSEKLAEIFGDTDPSADEEPAIKPKTPAKPAAKNSGSSGAKFKKPAPDDSGRLELPGGVDEENGPTYFIALADDEAKPAEETNPYLADEGLSPDELGQFILKMQDKPKTIQKRPGFAEAIADASDRILAAKDVQDKIQFIAIEAKLDALHKRACLGDEKCDSQLKEFIAKVKDDQRAPVAKQVKFFQLERETIEADQLPLDKLPELFARLKEFFAKEQLTARHLRLASSTVALVNRLEAGDAREKEFKEFGGLLAKSSDKQLARYGKKIAKTPAESESKLVGQPLELAGSTSEGQPFKWPAYRGKVVLVDFWATWCGPCRREMPHVKELYEKHKDKGLEVVGVSLDKDLEALAEYLQENAIAWTTLSGDDTQDLAEKYGVRAIPTMMLVDKDGKIVAISHNLEALTEKIEKLLAPASEK